MTYCKKSPVVGRITTEQGCCDALTNGYGNLNGINLNFDSNKESLHAGQESGSSRQNIFGPQCWKQIIPGSDVIVGAGFSAITKINIKLLI